MRIRGFFLTESRPRNLEKVFFIFLDVLDFFEPLTNFGYDQCQHEKKVTLGCNPTYEEKKLNSYKDKNLIIIAH